MFLGVSARLTLPIVLLALLVPAGALAQTAETESAGRSREGRAWGEAPPEASDGGSASAYHRYGHIFASVGVGGTVRLIAFADVCDPDAPGREGCRFSPPYFQLRGGWLFETDSEIQHGVGLGIGTNLTADGTVQFGIDGGAQWTFTPAYHIRYWFDQWFQLMGHIGVPLSVAAVTGTLQSGTDFNWGLEAQAGAIFKFLQGLGVYAAVNFGLTFAGDDRVWPMLSGEAGLVFDYEVLP